MSRRFFGVAARDESATSKIGRVLLLKARKRAADQGLMALDARIGDLEGFLEEGGGPDLSMRLDVVQSFEDAAAVLRAMMDAADDLDVEYMKQSAIRLVRLARVTERFAVFGETVH